MMNKKMMERHQKISIGSKSRERQEKQQMVQPKQQHSQMPRSVMSAASLKGQQHLQQNLQQTHSNFLPTTSGRNEMVAASHSIDTKSATNRSFGLKSTTDGRGAQRQQQMHHQETKQLELNRNIASASN